ncbi:putative membrane protein [Bacillus phage vB_BspM_MarvelLand]|nr:putative membrane protein [Bacillus phage vB_BspM_MarvelLand]
MESGHHPRSRAGVDKYSECLPSILPGETSLRQLRLLKTSLIKYAKIATIPVAAISTFFFTSITDRAYAASTNSFFDGQGGSMFQTVTNFFTGQVQNSIPDPIQKIIDWFGEFTKLIENLPKAIGQMSADLMAWVYQLCSDLILKTPLWLFDNEWFFNMCHLFSAVALGAATVLTIIEGIKRMLSGVKDGRKSLVSQPMEFSTIIKRWSMVAGLTAVVPYLFQRAFQFLNFLSEKISSLGGDTMKAAALSTTFSTVDVIALIAFDVVLISTVIPLLWQNGRRFFDLLVLGVVTPLALVAWVFDSYRHLFNQWWSNLKHLSLVQVFHSLFLLIIGWFIFGIPTPVDFTGTVIKLIVVIGGFGRMTNPPNIIAKHLDNRGGMDAITGTKKKNAVTTVMKNLAFSKKAILSPMGLLKKLKK